MAKYEVRYIHEVEITYNAVVEADSPEEARQKMEDFDFISEEEVDRQGIDITIENVTEMEDDNE